MNLAARWTLLVLVLASLMQVQPVRAQATIGNATTGQALYDDTASRNCKGCHGATIVTNYPKVVNSANSGTQLIYSANAQAMGGTILTPTQANDIAAHIAMFVPDPAPANLAVPFNTAVQIPLSNVFLNSTYGDYTGLETVTMPTRGTVTYSGTTATYTPTAGQTGNDSFTYRAVRGANCVPGCSNIRTVTVNIGPPASVLTVYNIGTGTGTVVSQPVGINCGSTCSASFTPGTVVNLIATANPGSVFVSLNSQPSNTTQITLNANANVPVGFDLIPSDNFINAFPMVPSVSTGSSYAYKRLFNTGATKEVGEPNHAGNAGGSSYWYSWTAPFTGAVNVGTGSNANLFFSDFNTLLAVYTGNAVNALTLVAANDDNPALFPPAHNLLSAVTFQAIAGTTYKIAVDGFNAGVAAETGKIDLTIIQPGNDSFAARLPLTGSNITLTDNNTGAYVTDPGEPMHAGNAGGKSLWWSWTAPANGTFNINTAGSDFNTLLGVYTGTAVNALTVVASNDDAPASVTSAVSFMATAGTTYQIAVDGFNGATGNITLNISQQPPLAVTAVVSRKTHGAAGTQDLPLPNRLLPVTGNIDVEPRVIGSGHRIVFQFNRAVSAAGTVTVTNAAGMSIGAAPLAAASGSEVTVTLLNIPDRQRAKVTLTNINGEGLNASASVGFLVGDINNSRTVDPADVSGVKARSGQVTDASNFKFDLNVSGAINSTDISTVKARVNLTPL